MEIKIRIVICCQQRNRNKYFIHNPKVLNEWVPQSIRFLEWERELLQSMLNSFSIRFLIAAFNLPFAFHLGANVYEWVI